MSAPVGKRVRRVGVVANPYAGRSRDAVEAAVLELFERLRGREILVCRGSLAHELSETHGVGCHVVSCPAGRRDGSVMARATAVRLVEEGIDLLVGIGGDGTLCDAAAAIQESQARVALFGIGVGSSNVGPLVCAGSAGIAGIDWDRLKPVAVHGLNSSVSGRGLGVAFNDVVVGNTYFATRAGKRVDVDAAAKLRGIDRPGTPRTVCGRETWVAKNGRKVLDADGFPVAQILASPLNRVEVCSGKAISGLLCWGPYVGMDAVVAAVSTIMVRTRLSLRDAEAAEPLRLAHIGIGPDDVVEIGGLLPEATVIVDGNPMHRVAPGEVVELRLKMNAVTVLRDRAAY